MRLIKPQKEVFYLFLNIWSTLEHLGKLGVASGVHKPSSHDLPGPSQGTQQTLKTERQMMTENQDVCFVL